jgi:hypothetical protein
MSLIGKIVQACGGDRLQAGNFLGRQVERGEGGGIPSQHGGAYCRIGEGSSQ